MYRVLIAEDEDIIRKGLMYSINWAEMDCTIVGEARNGIEGVELIEKMKPDILIVDINMPVMDGIEMIRRTCEEYSYSAIILSGYSNFEYAKRAIHYGVTDYLLKPLKREEMVKAIESAKERRWIYQSWLAQQQEAEELKNVRLVSRAEETGEHDEIVKELLKFIEEHYQEKIGWQDVVEAMNYSETFLNRKFKTQMGTTFIEYLNRFRIQKAVELLNQGNIAIQDVSWMCGIGDYKYFNMVFKKYIGCSPKEYTWKVKEQPK